ncbi:MAG TPA: hypothetical protein VF179_14915 [Thermoanaerobaculia bacterium]|nr:hypothetical protein [Thermoanaerobaculia bacterium]
MRVRSIFLLLVALLSPSTLMAENQQPSRAPVVLVEINSNGDVRLLLAVYNDGEAILARKDTTHPEGEICIAAVPAEALAVLEETLRDAGALRLDDAIEIAGLTRKTISFFAGPDQHGRTHGNTFGYSRAEGPYLIVARAVQDVLNNHFGGCR